MQTHQANISLISNDILKAACLDNSVDILQQRKSIDGKLQDWWYYYIPGATSDTNSTDVFIDNPFGGDSGEFAFQVRNLQIASVVGSQFQGNNSNIIYHHFDGKSQEKAIIVNPETPLYVKLTNTSDIVIDRLDIEITNLQNETTQSLEGITYITLQFHENKTDKLIKQLIFLQNQNNTVKETTNQNFINNVDNLANKI